VHWNLFWRLSVAPGFRWPRMWHRLVRRERFLVHFHSFLVHSASRNNKKIVRQTIKSKLEFERSSKLSLELLT
jgi:hypothetical protein